jgi:hypothetical protein
MYIKTDDDWCDKDGNDLYENTLSYDWKEWREGHCQELADALDQFGIDVIEHNTRGDFYLFRLVKRKEE